MAESSSTHKEASETRVPQPPQHITLLQPQHRTSSRKDLEAAGVPDFPSPFSDDGGCPTPVTLPAWFEHLFPKLSRNETFLAFYWLLTTIVRAIKEAFLVDLFTKWIYLLKFVFQPTILFVQWTWWFYSSLFVRPALYIILSLASLLGITDALSCLLIKIIRGLDFYGDKFMTTIGVLIAYIKEQWEQASQDVLEAINKLKQWAKETLEATVRAAKYILTYLKELAEMVLPVAVYAWIVQWITIGAAILSGIYALSKYILTTFEKVLDIIKEAWRSEKVQSPTPNSSTSEKVFNVHPQQKQAPESSVGPAEPVKPVKSSSPAPKPASVDDSAKQRKA